MQMFTRLTKTRWIHWLADAPPTRYMTEKKIKTTYNTTAHSTALNVYNCVFTCVLLHQMLYSFHFIATLVYACVYVYSARRVQFQMLEYQCILARVYICVCMFVNARVNWKCSLGVSMSHLSKYILKLINTFTSLTHSFVHT